MSDRILNELRFGSGYEIVPALDSGSLDSLWDCVLDGFSSCFGLDSPSKKDMITIHLSESADSRFADLSVLDRTLKAESSRMLIQEPWLRNLSSSLGYYPVDAYGHGYPSFTWRLMRPGMSQDLRGVHRDVWFRTAAGNPEIIDPSIPSQIQTIKVWVALNVQPNKSGLLVSPGSQLEDKPTYSAVFKDGAVKPSVVESEVSPEKFVHADTANGSMVLFGEQLMHGGAPTHSDSSRVSLEFTLARIDQSWYETFICSNQVKSRKHVLN